ncbi:8011_t:CDS:2 [Acaulospora morrowiae]|uniref:8011_t:CDS:1 n=1 Tax=Acaulospora morrowiae TaxID=94023 RepID=A0A9N8WEY6_9GLOM|nr:8011_t:CDS:2 [Acaulospora morrowiae]
MSVQSSDFLAGYYLACTAVGGLIAGSIFYQTAQIRTYISRTRWPKVEDLPNRKTDRPAANKPDIHFALTVFLHKFWNSVIGFFDKTISEIVGLFLFIGLNIIFLLLPFQSGVGLVQQLNIRCAYIALANAAFVFPLATRNSIFVTLIGVPFERIITLHRWVGRTIFLLLTFHATYQIQSQYTGSLYNLLALSDVNKWGFLAYVFLIIIVIMSHSIFRRFAFEWFYWSHFNFIFFVIFGSLHQDEFLSFTGIGVGLYVIDRLIRFFVGLNKIDVVSMEAITSGVTRIVFRYPTYYEAGQYMFVNIPQLKLPVSLIAWHPFSYSSAPSAKDKGVHNASIHVKTQGGFTRTLYANSQKTEAPLKLRIDGPYGKPSIDFKAHRTVLLVAGGIGITPMISILRDLVSRQVTSMPVATQEIHFMWIIPDQVAHSWFAEEIREIIAQSSALPKEKYLLDIKIFFTRAKSTPSTEFFAGRPNFKLVFRDIKQFHGSGDIAVGVCGPAVMLNEVRNAAVSESDTSCLFHVHTETFEL